MRPLLFLTVRSFFNSIKRSVTSVRRLISLVVFIGYYIMVFVRPFERSSMRDLPTHDFGLTMPSTTVIDACIFALFAFLTLFLGLGVFGVKGTFRPADVDVLFPTPVSPKLVLVFRIVRDYLFTLLLPLFFALVLYRPASTGIFALFRNMQNVDANKVMRAVTVSWILVALCWVTIGYAVGLFVNRSDLNSERNKKILNWGSFASVIGILAFILWNVTKITSFEGVVALTEQPVLRIFFFTATAATAMVMGTLPGGNFSFTILGAVALLSVITTSVWVAMGQAGWMYDQAASRGTDAQTLRTLQRQGDMIGMMAERARSGKLKAGRRRWLQKLNLKGPLALVWKELIVQTRSSSAMFWIFVPMSLAMSLMPVLVSKSLDSGSLGALFLAMQGFAIFMMVVSLSQSGFIELLRRVDLQKPLPFTSASIVSAEVAAKIIPAVLVSWLGALIALILRPVIWSEALGSIVLAPFVALVMASVVFLVTILFPDVDDPTQRGFRGLVTFFGLAMLLLPVILAMAGLMFVKVPAVLAAFVSAAFALGVSAGVSMIAGRFYESYNPSE